MTDEKVVQLAEKHRISGSDGALAAIREAYDVGRRDGPQWVKCSEREPDEEGRYLIQYRQAGQVRIFVGDYVPREGWLCHMVDMEILQWQKIVPPAANSCSDATAVEAKRTEPDAI